jgi:hypothetical protein
VAARHAAHPRRPRRCGGPSTTRRRRRTRLSRSTTLLVRSRATRAGPMPDSEGHRAPQRCQPRQNRRWRPVRCSRYASQPPAVRSEGRWNHLSVYMRLVSFRQLATPDSAYQLSRETLGHPKVATSRSHQLARIRATPQYPERSGRTVGSRQTVESLIDAGPRRHQTRPRLI